MEFAPLGDLRKYLSSTGKPLSVEMGVTFLRQALEAMEFIHATGVLHRDVKPDNILLVSESEIRLADFGLALLPGDELDLEELQNGVGSLAYLPPELLDGLFYDTRSDLYSLGVCFYEAMTGTHPFEHAPLSEQKNVRLDQNIKPLHDVNPLIPQHMSAVVAMLMRYSADQRFQTPMEALRALANPEFAAKPATAPSTDAKSVGTGDSSLVAHSSANIDELEDEFTTDFDDFFGIDDDDLPAPQQTPLGVESPAPSQSVESEAQQIAQSTPHEPTDTSSSLASRALSGTQTSSGIQDNPTGDTRSIDSTTPSTSPGSQERAASARPQSSRNRTSMISRHSLPRRILGVAACAALLTVAAAVVSSLKPATIISQSAKSLVAEIDSETEESYEFHGNGDFPRIPPGIYAGTVQGVLPGITSPLALISRPKEDTITVVIGIEGWSPTTVSTRQQKGEPSATIVVRSNGVLLNMTGATSPEEVTGTFVNAVTGESGIWSAKKVKKIL